MTDKILRIKQALGLTEETEEKHARHNLLGAYIDIKHDNGHADEICIKTMSRVMCQLKKVEDILSEDDGSGPHTDESRTAP